MPAATSALLASRLRESLTSRYQAPVHLAAISVRSNSTVFMARIGTDPEVRLAVKCCHVPGTSEPNGRIATEQFNAFEKLGNAFGASTPEFRVPAVVFFDLPLAAIGMRWIDGESLTQRLTSLLAVRRIASSMEKAGAWLGHFHRVGPLRDGHFNYGERHDYVTRMAAQPLAQAVFSRAARLLVDSRNLVEAQPVRYSWLHGDCKSDNIFFADAATFGIDISVAHENCIEHDLAQFLNHLELLLLRPAHLHLAAFRQPIEAAFWKGYRSTGPEVSVACLPWVRLWALLGLWQSTVEGRASRVSSWAINRMFSRVCARLAAELARAQPRGAAVAGLAGGALH